MARLSPSIRLQIWKLRKHAANSSDIPPVEWTAFVDHYMDSTTKEKKLGRPVCRNEVIISTLLKKYGNYVSGEGQRLAKKIVEHLPQDQECTVTEGIHSKVLAHLNDAIEKVCGLENGKRRIFRATNCEGSNSSSQQHIANLEKQLQKIKDQVYSYLLS
ncbi:hypothetical protein Ahy_B02g060614 isoform A [Arachis hypogaea]|uniref:Uncharacterized protein n=1 Tax=Arachis hypogaea TaxID=3818 RepID=A0A445AIX2_ARAHY|nr:hypothetical protein Ahy_B02g060614 isoform A [Arachis hypogaea]